MTANAKTFETRLTETYKVLYETDPAYTYVATQMSPERLAAKMTLHLANGSASKDGLAIKRVCKLLGIKHTYKAIREYLRSSQVPLNRD